MIVLKCKMCGGTLDVQEGMTVCECEYCGSKQTIPNIDNEKKMKLFDRANRLRINCEFDKAGSVYESIIEEFPEEAEGYWGILLCKYGIEYVDDPTTGDKIPTCHRASFESIMDDEDFEMVMENADSVSRSVYRDQAKQIEELRKGIMEVSSKEAPYDIFICYKETDENGDRTIDSVIAQDVYDALTGKGYRVFFSRISLEDKLGTEYEPYIFAALNSAKVMLAFGTSYDYYNAVWVKNEWSRFLRLMAKDKGKYLIPCYKDIDAYDIPKEFAKLQAQDMGKVGALQDLLRGIDKIFGKDEAQKTQGQPQVIQQVVTGGANVKSLLKRGYDALEDGAFDEAKGFFNDALNSDPESAEAYLGLFMADIKSKDKTSAKSKFVVSNYTINRYWKRARQYARGDISDELLTWVNERNVHLKRVAEEKARQEEEAKRIEERLCLEEENQRQEEKEKLRNLIDELRSIKPEKNERVQETEQQITILEKELEEKKHQYGKLGFFKMKEKNELQQQISILSDSVKELKGSLQEIVSKQEEQIIQRIIEILKKQLKSFGRYYDGKPIEWIVLNHEGHRVLLLSKYALDTKQFNDVSKGINWEKCTLRKWLNNSFLNEVFNQEEAEIIETTNVRAEKNPEYRTSPGVDTQDKIFLLSVQEAEKYFQSDNERVCKPTEYAVKHGAYSKIVNRSQIKGELKTEKLHGDECEWWLRTPGENSQFTALVRNNGKIDYFGNNAKYDKNCLRPALWIDLLKINV